MQTSLANLIADEFFVLYKRGKAQTEQLYRLDHWVKPYTTAMCEVIGGEKDGQLVKFGGSKQVSAPTRIVRAIREKTPLSELTQPTTAN